MQHYLTKICSIPVSATEAVSLALNKLHACWVLACDSGEHARLEAIDHLPERFIELLAHGPITIQSNGTTVTVSAGLQEMDLNKEPGPAKRLFESGTPTLSLDTTITTEKIDELMHWLWGYARSTPVWIHMRQQPLSRPGGAISADRGIASEKDLLKMIKTAHSIKALDQVTRLHREHFRSEHILEVLLQLTGVYQELYDLGKDQKQMLPPTLEDLLNKLPKKLQAMDHRCFFRAVEALLKISWHTAAIRNCIAERAKDLKGQIMLPEISIIFRYFRMTKKPRPSLFKYLLDQTIDHLAHDIPSDIKFNHISYVLYDMAWFNMDATELFERARPALEEALHHKKLNNMGISRILFAHILNEHWDAPMLSLLINTLNENKGSLSNRLLNDLRHIYPALCFERPELQLHTLLSERLHIRLAAFIAFIIRTGKKKDDDLLDQVQLAAETLGYTVHYQYYANDPGVRITWADPERKTAFIVHDPAKDSPGALALKERILAAQNWTTVRVETDTWPVQGGLEDMLAYLTSALTEAEPALAHTKDYSYAEQ